MTAGRAAVLAIDGGNSKTDVALVAADGTLLASARGPGSNAHIIGLDEAMAVIGRLATAAARQAALAADSAPAADSVLMAEHVSACLAGADLTEDEERLGAALNAQGWALTCTVVNDTFAILRAGLVPGLIGTGTAAGGSGPALGRGRYLRCRHQLRRSGAGRARSPVSGSRPGHRRLGRRGGPRPGSPLVGGPG